MKLLGTRLLVKPLPQVMKSAGGLHLVGEYNNNQVHHQVVSVGPKVKEVQVNDRVIVHSFQGTQYEFEGSNARIIDESDVMLVIGRGE